MSETRWCAECRDETPFEVPPCQDGHDDCPDLACVECGHAITVGVLLADAPVELTAAA